MQVFDDRVVACLRASFLLANIKVTFCFMRKKTVPVMCKDRYETHHISARAGMSSCLRSAHRIRRFEEVASYTLKKGMRTRIVVGDGG